MKRQRIDSHHDRSAPFTEKFREILKSAVNGIEASLRASVSGRQSVPPRVEMKGFKVYHWRATKRLHDDPEKPEDGDIERMRLCAVYSSRRELTGGTSSQS